MLLLQLAYSRRSGSNKPRAGACERQLAQALHLQVTCTSLQRLPGLSQAVQGGLLLPQPQPPHGTLGASFGMQRAWR